MGHFKKFTARTALGVVVAAGLTAGLLSSCQSSDPAGTAVSSTPNAKKSSTTKGADGSDPRFPLDLSVLEEDPLTDLLPPDGQDPRFFYAIEDNRGECYVSDGNVLCSTENSTTMEQIDFPIAERPVASVAGINADGWTMSLDFLPPLADFQLRTGHYVNFGDVVCAKPDDQQMICETPNAQVVVVGRQQEFLTTGVEMPYHIVTEFLSKPVVKEVDDDGIARAISTCRIDGGDRKAVVVQGETTCKTVSEVVTTHEQIAQELAAKGQLDPASPTETDDWMCFWNTPEEAAKTDTTALCGTSDLSVTIQVPLQ